MELKIIKTTEPRKRPTGPLGFGKYFTDHMFVMEYENGEWGNARIQPYQNFSLQPACSVFHYGQACFEGTKAYKNKQGEIRLFRTVDNLNRMNDSADRICIPKFDVDFVLDAIKKLILLDEDWIPTEPGTSLYLRPAMMGCEDALGVHAAKKYILFVILSPVGAYYANGLAPVKLYVEEKYVRAARGGTGHHKVVGNYAASLKAGEEAKKIGYDQVMWLDAIKHRYVEEVGAMNIFFVVDGKVLTPALLGSILPGITRRSVIQLLKDKGIPVEETEVDIEMIAQAAENGKLTEVFGTGTAAVISPVGAFRLRDKEYVVNGGEMGPIAKLMYDTLTKIQVGELPDPHGWVTRIK